MQKADCSGAVSKRFSDRSLTDRKLLLDIMVDKDYIVVVPSEKDRAGSVFCLYRSAIQQPDLPEEMQYAYIDL